MDATDEPRDVGFAQLRRDARAQAMGIREPKALLAEDGRDDPISADIDNNSDQDPVLGIRA